MLNIIRWFKTQHYENLQKQKQGLYCGIFNITIIIIIIIFFVVLLTIYTCSLYKRYTIYITLIIVLITMWIFYFMLFVLKGLFNQMLSTNENFIDDVIYFLR